MKPGIFSESARCLSISDPEAKCLAVDVLHARLSSGDFHLDEQAPIPPCHGPGRPEKPPLVNPVQVPRRRLGTQRGRVALVHAIAHIEFNAINLALDATCRFRGMPEAFYHDWLSVAADEARHFTLLSGRLQELGAAYGDYPAHNGLWEMAEESADSCLARMALVPRVLEARGLDVTPGLIERLRRVGDQQTADCLQVILEEELRHVAIGSSWFTFCCEREGVDPSETFLDLIRTRYRGVIRGPFNKSARLAAGFTENEMAALESAP